MSKQRQGWKVLNGISYPPRKRADVGDIVYDLPPESIGWLRDQKQIEPVETPDDSDQEAT